MQGAVKTAPFSFFITLVGKVKIFTVKIPLRFGDFFGKIVLL